MEGTFAERFCRHHRIPPERYRFAMFCRCMYWRALILSPVLWLLRKEHFGADFELISNVGFICKREELDVEIDAYAMHVDNRNFSRRVLRLRISTKRVRHVVKSLMRAARYESQVASLCARDSQ
jgi:hypothetical protein